MSRLGRLFFPIWLITYPAREQRAFRVFRGHGYGSSNRSSHQLLVKTGSSCAGRWYGASTLCQAPAG
jgi:hypothetical protein